MHFLIIKGNETKKTNSINKTTRQRIKIGSVLTTLREHRPNIKPYMGMHRTDFYVISVRLVWKI